MALITSMRSTVQGAWSSVRQGVGKLCLPSHFMSPQDVRLFLRSARTDAKINALRPLLGNASAFDDVYRVGDPWASGDPRYRYQSRKYEVLEGLLPSRHFTHALDLGCGLGHFTRLLASRADRVLGIDISQKAVELARARHADLTHLSFMQGDLFALPKQLNGRFDLVAIADTIYYLPPPIENETLKLVARCTAQLLRPGGILMLCNHYFYFGDAESRLSRRIHDAFAWSPGLVLQSEHRRPFYLTSLLARPQPEMPHSERET